MLESRILQSMAFLFSWKIVGFHISFSPSYQTKKRDASAPLKLPPLKISKVKTAIFRSNFIGSHFTATKLTTCSFECFDHLKISSIFFGLKANESRFYCLPLRARLLFWSNNNKKIYQKKAVSVISISSRKYTRYLWYIKRGVLC